MLDAFLEGEREDPDLLECYFLEALYCSLGASLLGDGRLKFDECIKRLASLPSADMDGVWAKPGELPGRDEWCLFPCPERLRRGSQRACPLMRMLRVSQPVCLCRAAGGTPGA